MKLVYYKKETPNFGDDLNAVLWPYFAPQLFDDDPAVGFVGIGTIIGMPVGDLRRLHVFSSGAGNDHPTRWRDKDVQYECVRGPISAHVLGLPAGRAITDGAILTPLAAGFPQHATGTGGTILIPHWETLKYPGWAEVAAIGGYELVDPRDDPYHVIARIAAAKLVLTESLHGAILADTYGVPWRTFATSRNFSIGKCADWTLSLGRPFEVTMVPPPNPEPLLAFGQCVAPFGETLHFDMERGLAEMSSRVASPPPAGPITQLRQLAKLAVRRSPWLYPLMGFSPARTAEALAGLSRADTIVTTPTQRGELQDLMLSRLHELARRSAS